MTEKKKHGRPRRSSVVSYFHVGLRITETEHEWLMQNKGEKTVSQYIRGLMAANGMQEQK